MGERVDWVKEHAVEIFGGTLLSLGLVATPFAAYEGFQPRVEGAYADCAKKFAPQTEDLTTCNAKVAGRSDWGQKLAVSSVILSLAGGGFIVSGWRSRSDEQ